MSSAKRGDNRPSRERYHKELHLITNKTRRIIKSYGKNKAGGQKAAEVWKSQYGTARA